MKKLFLFIFTLSFYLNSLFGQNCLNMDREGGVVIIKTEIPTEVPPFLPPPPPPPPPISVNPDSTWKRAFWVHGIGGNDRGWSNASSLSTVRIPNLKQTVYGDTVYVNDLISFPPREMRNEFPSYGVGEDILDYAVDIKDFMYQAWLRQDTTIEYARENNFVIAHSMGGINTKGVELVVSNNPDEFFPAGGLATFGTPHHGAKLADNLVVEHNPSTITRDDIEFESIETIGDGTTGALLVTDQFRNFLNEAKDELIAGPKEQAIQNSFILRLVKDVVFEKVDKFVDEIISLVPTIAGGGFLSRTVLNLQTDNDQLLYTYNATGNYQKVAFFGTEDKELTLWKMAYWAINNPNNVASKISIPEKNQGYFAAGDDAIAIEIFDKNLAKYEMKFNEAERLRNVYHRRAHSFPCNISPVCHLFYINARNKQVDRMRAWERGLNWWKNSTDFWNLLSGASTYETTTTNPDPNICRCYDPNQDDQDQETEYYFVRHCIPNQPGDICTPITPVTTTSEVYKPNDGVVLAESAMDFQGAKYKLKLEGSCHFQMRNDESLRQRLKWLYNQKQQDLTSFHTKAINFN